MMRRPNNRLETNEQPRGSYWSVSFVSSLAAWLLAAQTSVRLIKGEEMTIQISDVEAGYLYKTENNQERVVLGCNVNGQVVDLVK